MAKHPSAGPAGGIPTRKRRGGAGGGRHGRHAGLGWNVAGGGHGGDYRQALRNARAAAKHKLNPIGVRHGTQWQDVGSHVGMRHFRKSGVLHQKLEPWQSSVMGTGSKGKHMHIGKPNTGIFGHKVIGGSRHGSRGHGHSSHGPTGHHGHPLQILQELPESDGAGTSYKAFPPPTISAPAPHRFLNM